MAEVKRSCFMQCSSSMQPEGLVSLYFSSSRGASNPNPTVDTLVGPVIAARLSGNKEGRGLVTTRAVKQGELLLISKPIVEASVDRLFKAFKRAEDQPLDRLAEQDILEQLIQLTNESRAAVDIIRGMADGEGTDMPLPPDLTVANQGPGELERTTDVSTAAGDGETAPLDRAYLAKVISANANGPDFRSYDQIAADWRKGSQPGNHRRVLGLYVVPSLINHSCVSNACRVFVGEIMLVRATKDLAADEEIVCPYLPPLQILKDRERHLQAAFGFQCACARCLAERGLGEGYLSLQGSVMEALRSGVHDNQEQLDGLVDQVEEALTAIKSNETRRWARASFLSLYFAYFNGGSPLTEASQKKMERLQAELHYSLLVVNNASTEHLSLLHCCYENAGLTYGIGSQRSRLWIDQLQRAHQARYGALPPGDLTRMLLKHTKGILRSVDGFQQAQWQFL